MKIIVVGCGKIGTAIIKNLVKEGHDVTVMDTDRKTVDEVSNVYDVIGVVGNGADYDTLAEADASKTDVLVAATGSDELNMLSCFVAKRMGVGHTIARIRNPEYNDKNSAFMKQQLGISLSINPELFAAQEMFNILKLPSVINIETFSRRNFEMVELLIKNDSSVNGMSLIELRKKFQGNYLICVVQRENEVIIPDGNFVLRDGDRIGLTAESNEIQKLLKGLGLLKKSARNVTVLGAGRVSYYLTKMLLSSGNSVKVIDNDPKVCEEFSNALPEALVVNGDGSEQEVLLEEGIDSTDAFVALTGMDEENILISFFAAAHNVPKIITKINRYELSDMASKLGLECIINPKDIIADIVSGYVRALQNSIGSNIETLYKLMNGKAEAAEFNVQTDFRYTGIPIKDLKLKKNILIAGIIRGRKSIIPSGDDAIFAADRVVVIGAGMQLNDLNDIFE